MHVPLPEIGPPSPTGPDLGVLIMFGPTVPEALHANATGNGADGGTSAATIVRGAEVASHMFNPTALINPPIHRAWPACIVTR
jgi:hypothetical protein